MNALKPLDGRAVGLMLVLCLIWSLQQIVLKATAAEFSPVLQIALRSGIAAGLVGLLMVWRGERLNTSDGCWQPGLLAGAIFAVEFLLLGEGLRHSSAAHMVVFLYTAPIFAALGLHWKLPAERLSALQWLGIGLAFAGIAIVFLLRSPSASAVPVNSLWGDLLGLLSGMAWGATTVVVRTTRLASLPATQVLLYQLLAAFVLLLPGALLFGHDRFEPSAGIWLSLIFQAVIVSFLSYLAWFWLLRHYLASRLGVFSFMTPLFGVLLGAWLLAEPIEPSFMAGALLVLTGVMLVSGHGLWRALLTAARRG